MPIDWSTRPSLDGDARAGERPAVRGLERAAVGLRHDQSEQTEVPHLRHELGGEVVRAVPLRDVGLDRLVAKSRTTAAKSSWYWLSSNIGRPFARSAPAPGQGARHTVTVLTLTSAKQYSPVCTPHMPSTRR